MRRKEIDALVRAHRGRAHPVAFFHVLRQTTLEDDDQAFLLEHAEVLTLHDLLAFRARCAPGFTGAVIARLSQIAVEEPGRFDHEILRAPRVELAEEEWIEIASRTRGKVPEEIHRRIEARGHGAREPTALADITPPEEGDFLAELAAALDDPGDPGFAAAPLAAEEAPEIILDRARHTFSSEERAALLGWLSQKGFARRPLVEIALAAVRAGSIDPTLVAWLAGQLESRAAWEAHGVDLFLAFLDPGAFSELEELLAQAWSAASRAGEKSPEKLLAAMGAAFAAALLQSTREALAAGDEDAALSALSALACLDPPARLSRSIHDLARAQRLDGAGGEVRTLVDLNVRLVKRGRAQEASFDGVIAALQGLADARLNR